MPTTIKLLPRHKVDESLEALLTELKLKTIQWWEAPTKESSEQRRAEMEIVQAQIVRILSKVTDGVRSAMDLLNCPEVQTSWDPRDIRRYINWASLDLKGALNGR